METSGLPGGASGAVGPFGSPWSESAWRLAAASSNNWSSRRPQSTGVAPPQSAESRATRPAERGMTRTASPAAALSLATSSWMVLARDANRASASPAWISAPGGQGPKKPIAATLAAESPRARSAKPEPATRAPAPSVKPSPRTRTQPVLACSTRADKDPAASVVTGCPGPYRRSDARSALSAARMPGVLAPASRGGACATDWGDSGSMR